MGKRDRTAGAAGPHRGAIRLSGAPGIAAAATAIGLFAAADPTVAIANAHGATTTEGTSMSDANTRRDGDIAIREEFDRARMKNTVEAWQLFLARHPDHPLAAKAAAQLAALGSSAGEVVKEPYQPRDGDAATVEAFNRAAATNTVEAWQLFIDRNPDHPLTAEARERLLLAQGSSAGKVVKEPYQPRDGDAATVEAFNRAAATNTVEAWQLFIDRNPGHALTAEARQRLSALTDSSAGEVVREPDRPRAGDAAIVEAFNRAAHTNSVESWQLFIARYPDHILTPEARDRLRALGGK